MLMDDAFSALLVTKLNPFRRLSGWGWEGGINTNYYLLEPTLILLLGHHSHKKRESYERYAL